MVNGTKALLNVALAVQALNLAGASLQVAKKKKVKTKDIVGLGITTIAGLSLLKAQKQIAGTL
ncbi:hypothetical protein LCGC14_0571360 [marine sediment metagenome]|uniref:Uncharacterized protein n=1 Tax=marine sediment metagenome TaxID=412755 RepID=A0A0F9USE3_9ZZZZ